MPVTTYAETVDHFAGRSAKAQERLSDWLVDDHYSEVVPFVQNHKTRALYELTSVGIERVCVQTEHALGEVRRGLAELVVCVRDWNPPFAFVHAIHYALELEEQFPTYQHLRNLCVKDEFLRNAVTIPSLAIVEEAVAQGNNRTLARDAVRWRVGNAYYSALREAYTLTLLREAGIPVLYHILADAMFCADLWIDDLVLSLYVGNATYKSSLGGRKIKPQRLLQDATPRFRFRDIELPAASVFGEVHLPSRKRVLSIAREISQRGASED